MLDMQERIQTAPQDRVVTGDPVVSPDQYETINANRIRWIEALESGNYAQTHGQLCTLNHDAFCCLGVLTDLFDPSWDDNTWEQAVPHQGVLRSVGLEYGTSLADTTLVDNLLGYNDGASVFFTEHIPVDHEWTFPEIAAYLREYWGIEK